MLAVTLVNPGTDITPAAASGIAASALTILSWIVPLGGLTMWIGAGASFARNRQAGIQVGPSALAIGGTILVASPAIVTGLQTSVGGTASPGMSWELFTFMPNPVFVASFVAAKTISRLLARR